MKWSGIFWRALLLISVLASGGCGVDSEKGILMAAGSYGDLAVVVSDESLKPMATRFVAEFNTSTTYVLREEPEYQVDFYGPGDWQAAREYKNILFLVQVGQGAKIEKIARKLLPKPTWQRALDAGGDVLQVTDPWSTYQYMIVIAARDRNTLSSLLKRKRETVAAYLAESNRTRILRRNRYEGLNKELMALFRDDLGFSLDIPLVYAQNQYQPDGYAGLELMQKSPSRGISISWVESADPTGDLSRRSVLLKLRREMGVRLHHEDLVEGSFVWGEAEIGGLDATRLQGAWTSQRFAGGGAFWSYFVPAPDQGRLYCLDILVYAPSTPKTNYFRHMAAIVSTFTVGGGKP